MCYTARFECLLNKQCLPHAKSIPRACEFALVHVVVERTGGEQTGGWTGIGRGVRLALAQPLYWADQIWAGADPSSPIDVACTQHGVRG